MMGARRNDVSRRSVAPCVALILLAAWSIGCRPDSRIGVSEYLAAYSTARPAVAGLAAASRMGSTTRPAVVPVLPVAPPYRLGPRDVIEATIYGVEAPDRPSTYRVRVSSRGQIVLPLVGKVDVGGLTLEQVEQKLAHLYAPQYVKFPQIIVDVVEYRRIEVLVLGMVNRPGVVRLRRDERTALKAVARAGGVNAQADRRVLIRRLRQPAALESYRLDDPKDLVRLVQRPPLEDGDILMFPQRELQMAFVEGLVRQPGPVRLPVDRPMTAMQALASAGGVIGELDPREATVYRRDPESGTVRIKLDLAKIRAGKAEDLTLAAGDVIEVPNTAHTWFVEHFRDFFSYRGGIDTTLSPWSFVLTKYGFDLDRRRDRSGGVFNRLQPALTNVLTTAVTPPAAPVQPAVGGP